MGLSELLDRAAAAWFGTSPQPARSALTFDQYMAFLTSGNARFPVTTFGSSSEAFGTGFAAFVQGAYAANGIVFACEMARVRLFAEASFAYRQRRDGAAGNLFSLPELEELRRPGPFQTTGDLLARMLSFADLGGQAFVVRSETGLKAVRPDWCVLVLGSRSAPATEPADVDAEPVGLVYWPGGPHSGGTPLVYLPDQFTIFRTATDPLAPWSGMSWITPIVREVMADSATTGHKLKFFENGATPNAVVTFDPTVDEKSYDAWVDAFEKKNRGAANAYRTVYLGGGTTLTPIGKDFQQIDFKAVQGAGETRIAAAAGVPPIIVGLSEGLAAATYSNYGQARRAFADGTLRPLWRAAAASLAKLVPVPADAELWYDDRDIPFLQEDMKDAADIASTQAVALRNLVDAGFAPDAAVSAITSGDFKALTGQHAGLYSVQLQPAGSVPQTNDAARSLAEIVAPFLAQRGERYVVSDEHGPVSLEGVEALRAHIERREGVRQRIRGVA